VNEIRPLAENARSRDRLLYLMEAGIILHTMGSYENSNNALREAEALADAAVKSVSKSAAAFLLNDTKNAFIGENFERVQIKFYIALNYLLLGDIESAKRYFRRLNYELRDMKFFDAEFKQNICARYIDAVISEQLENFNDARVEYNNISALLPEFTQINSDRYVLALKSGDEAEMKKYETHRTDVLSYNQSAQRVPYRKGMAELLIINQAGKSAVKASRGKIANDQAFLDIMRAGIAIAVMNQGAGLSTTTLIAMVSQSENPVPVYRMRDPLGALPLHIILNGNKIGRTVMLDTFSQTTQLFYNQNYQKIVSRNVASIASKVVVAAVAAKVASDELNKAAGIGGNPLGFLVSGAVGAGMGKAVSETINPDLRCWRLLADNTQVLRFFLEPGTYTIDAEFPYPKPFSNHTKREIILAENGFKVICIRSMTGDTSMQPPVKVPLDVKAVQAELRN